MRARSIRVLASSWFVVGSLAALFGAGQFDSRRFAAADQSASVPVGNPPRFAVNPLLRARRFLESLPPGDRRKALELVRPAPVSPEARARVLAGLPRTGELRPDAAEAIKLAGLESVLRYHARDNVYVVKLVDVPQAAIGLHARSVVLISRPALRLLATAELQALVTHEVGHEFFWDEYHHARAQRDTPGLQEVELKCDAIAALTLLGLELDPLALTRGAQAMIRYNSEVMGQALNERWYPSLRDRERFVREVVNWWSRWIPR
jgi:hypothetical protein